jgi:hypothetical protein
MGLVSQALEAIPVYTGLSPGTFFTVLALVVAAYYLISGLLAPPPFKYVPMEPLPPPVQLGDVTLEELAQYDGTDPKKQLLMAIKGQIYDVSQSRCVRAHASVSWNFFFREVSGMVLMLIISRREILRFS